jgi:ankyrin repeat protein
MLLDLDPSRGVDPSAHNSAALLFASINGHAEIVEMLLQLDLSRGVDPSAMDNQALRDASSRGHVDTVRILLNLDPSRGVRLTRTVVERVFHHDLLSWISEEIFNMYD